ncbi:MAG: class I SAM-dependent methyltransferase [Actinomycetia bacterium]|nr:class I SAM-dependent methyltransferase [Actinomycetes bacterium]
MGFYGDRVFPRILNVVMNSKQTRRIRSEVCAPLAGEVVEIGFGTGLNLPHMPEAVVRLQAVDPMERGRALAATRIAASAVPVEFIGLDGQELALADASVDGVLATWTLCSIPDAVAAVREIRRVLKPGGKFHFVEHGRAPDEKVRKWQNRMNPVQKRLAGGCNLNRDIPALIEGGGLTIERLDTFYAKGEPKTMGWTYQGVAHA